MHCNFPGIIQVISSSKERGSMVMYGARRARVWSLGGDTSPSKREKELLKEKLVMKNVFFLPFSPNPQKKETGASNI